MASAEGYQPTGRNPSTSLWARSATRTAATSLLSALATNSIWFSRSSARALGVEPSGEFAVSAVEIFSIIWRVLVSMTATVLSFAQETKRRPSFDRAMSFGLSPTAIRPMTWSVLTSNDAHGIAAPVGDVERLSVVAEHQGVRVHFDGNPLQELAGPGVEDDHVARP